MSIIGFFHTANVQRFFLTCFSQGIWPLDHRHDHQIFQAKLMILFSNRRTRLRISITVSRLEFLLPMVVRACMLASSILKVLDKFYFLRS